MKLTIDTREDSPEQIKKAIRMLYSLVQEREVHTNQGNIFENPDSMTGSSSEETGNVFGNLFGDDSSSSSTETKEPEKEELPEIIPY
jgi:hypothetical protein